MPVYWFLLHKYVMEIAGDNLLDKVVTVCIHSVPFMTVISNIVLSRIEFRRSDLVYCMIFSVGYGFINFSSAYYLNFIVYPFIPWTNIESYVIGSVLLLAVYVMFHSLCSGVDKVRGL